jgi:hypothetical protein
MLRAIANENDLTRTTLQHIKSVLSTIFTYARNKGAFDGANPVNGVLIPRRAVLQAVQKVQARIEDLRRAKEDRRQLELKFGDVVIAESSTGAGFPPFSPVKTPCKHHSIVASVVSC